MSLQWPGVAVSIDADENIILVVTFICPRRSSAVKHENARVLCCGRGDSRRLQRCRSSLHLQKRVNAQFWACVSGALAAQVAGGASNARAAAPRFYLTAFADRFLVVSQKRHHDSSGGSGRHPGGIRGLPSPPKSPGTSSQNRSWRCQNSIPGPHFECPEPAVGHFVVFEFPELHSRATF